jgi:hypothetical protein
MSIRETSFDEPTLVVEKPKPPSDTVDEPSSESSTAVTCIAPWRVIPVPGYNIVSSDEKMFSLTKP